MSSSTWNTMAAAPLRPPPSAFFSAFLKSNCKHDARLTAFPCSVGAKRDKTYIDIATSINPAFDKESRDADGDQGGQQFQRI